MPSNPSKSMHISQYLMPGSVAVGLDAADKESFINAVVDLLEGRSEVKDLDEVRRSVLEREWLMSTGVGKGLALPHAKTHAVSGTMAALVVTRSPIPWDAIDGEPVRLVFLLVGVPDAKSEHVKILSRISRIMNRDAVRTQLTEATTAEELLKTLRNAEESLLDE
jgi:PTS system fructose-specific IIA component